MTRVLSSKIFWLSIFAILVIVAVALFTPKASPADPTVEISPSNEQSEEVFITDLFEKPTQERITPGPRDVPENSIPNCMLGDYLVVEGTSISDAVCVNED